MKPYMLPVLGIIALSSAAAFARTLKIPDNIPLPVIQLPDQYTGRTFVSTAIAPYDLTQVVGFVWKKDPGGQYQRQAPIIKSGAKTHNIQTAATPIYSVKINNTASGKLGFFAIAGSLQANQVAEVTIKDASAVDFAPEDYPCAQLLQYQMLRPNDKLVWVSGAVVTSVFNRIFNEIKGEVTGTASIFTANGSVYQSTDQGTFSQLVAIDYIELDGAGLNAACGVTKDGTGKLTLPPATAQVSLGLEAANWRQLKGAKSPDAAKMSKLNSISLGAF